MDKLDYILMMGFIVLAFIGGIIIGTIFYSETDCPQNITYHKCREQGLWNRDNTGEWVSINIEDMSYERAVEVCKHEVGHEMFAEVCEKDMERCFKVVEMLNETNKEL